MSAPTLFDSIEETTAAKEDGIQRADVHADDAWKLAAFRAIECVAAIGEPFTSDEVIVLMEADPNGPTTHNLAALGGVFRRAASSGLIRKANATRPSKLARRHRDLTVWTRADTG